MNQEVTMLQRLNRSFEKKSNTSYSKRSSQRGLTNLAQKIIGVIIILANEDDQILNLTIDNITKFLGLEKNGGQARANIIKSLKEIAQLKMWVSNGDAIVTVAWITDVIVEKTGEIRILLDPTMRELFFNTSSGFTAMNWFYVISMKSKFGARLYELLYSQLFRRNRLNEEIFEINDLRRMLGIENSVAYEKPAQVFKRAVMPAIDDINAHADLIVSASYEKMNKSYFYKFVVHEKSERAVEQMLVVYNENKAIQNVINSLECLRTYNKTNKMTVDEFTKSKKSIIDSVHKQISNSYEELDVNYLITNDDDKVKE